MDRSNKNSRHQKKNNDNEILIKCEPLVYTRAQRTVQKKEEKKC